MTVARYIAIVALVYTLAFAAVLAYASDLELKTILAVPHLWIFPTGAAVMAVLGTVAPIARFGNVGGSRFTLPSILHSAVLLSLAIAVVATK